jgi:transcriptional regulator with GAF, ATPase, and Fis domain
MCQGRLPGPTRLPGARGPAPVGVSFPTAASVRVVLSCHVAHESEEVVQVAQTFATVARTLAEDHGDLQSSLEAIVHLAVDNLDACEFAGISLVEKRKINSPASSNGLPKKVDQIQSEVSEGPCIDAIKEHEVVQTGDLRNEKRWRNFSMRAYDETGVCSIVSIRLFIEEDTMGALNLYSSARDAFDDSDVALGSVFAAHASVAMSAARREESLKQKAESRDVIGRAKGILMARSAITDDQAFAMLKAASQRMNEKLRDVAQRIVEQAPSPPKPE